MRIVLDTDVASGLIKQTLTAAMLAKIAMRPMLPGGRDVATKWGEIVAYAEKRGRPRPVNDSWIAACCLTYDLPLATLNVGHFDDFVEFEGLRLLTP